MNKFKVGDRVRILSDARVYAEARTVVDCYKVKSAVGLIATIGKPSVTESNRFLIYDLPLECYGQGDLFWSYREDQLELVTDPELPTVESITVKVEIDGEGVNRIMGSDKADMVNHPAHYTSFPMELKNWNFGVMQTIKDPIYCAYFKTMSEYLHRAHLKNGLEDIKKLLFWGNELVKHVEDGKVEVK